jgi:hypothetical protein
MGVQSTVHAERERARQADGHLRRPGGRQGCESGPGGAIQPLRVFVARHDQAPVGRLCRAQQSMAVAAPRRRQLMTPTIVDGIGVKDVGDEV